MIFLRLGASKNDVVWLGGKIGARATLRLARHDSTDAKLIEYDDDDEVYWGSVETRDY